MDRYRAGANINSNHPSKAASTIPSYQKEERELSIFDAKHYYSEGSKSQNTLKSPVIVNQKWRSHSFRSTPTSSSEASWNSQSGLLSNPPGSAALCVKSCTVSKKSKPGTSRNFFSLNYPFFGRKTSDGEEKYSTPVGFSMEKEHSMTSPAKMKISAGLNWPKDFAQTKPGDDGVASVTSSDLFEIDGFAANSAYHRRDSLDDYLKLGQRECYAPSEASVEWSIATAAPAFDGASVGPFDEDSSDTRPKHEPSPDKKRGRLFTCCKDSVNVGPSPARMDRPKQRL